MDNSNWYVLWIENGKEYEVKERLISVLPKKDYEKIIVPYKNMPKRIAGKWFTTKEKLFAGYIFIVTEDPNKIVPYLEKFSGFVTFLKVGKDISPIFKEEVDFLTTLMGDNDEADLSKGIINGDILKIISGPLVGQEAKVKKIDRHKRKAVVVTELLGRCIEVTVGLEIVKRID